MWDRKLNILGNTVTLDQFNLDIENENRLPRFLLFRQVNWAERYQPGVAPRWGTELFLELALMGFVSRIAEPRWVARQHAMAYPGYQWTLVELGWYPDRTETGPYIHDILVYKTDGQEADGTYVDSQQRDREARLAARAARAAKETE